MRRSFSFSPSSILSTGTPVQRDTTCATWSAVTASSTMAPLPSLPSIGLQLLFELGNAAIGQFAGALVFALALRIGELDCAARSSSVLSFCASESLSFSDFQRAVRSADCFSSATQLAFEVLQPCLGAGIALLLERLLLDLEPHDLAIDGIELLGLGIDLHLQPRRRLVDEVDRLVRAGSGR